MEKQLFQPPDRTRLRGRYFAASVVVHTCLLAAAVALPLFSVESIKLKPYSVTMLVPPSKEPEVTHWKVVKAAVRKPLVAPSPVVPRQSEARIDHSSPLPPVEQPKIEAPAARPAVHLSQFDAPADTKPQGHTVETTARQVQTGGFGDEKGVSNVGRPNRAWDVASLGSFDLPVSDGVGNGTSGSRGARGRRAGSESGGAGFDSVAGAGNGAGGAGVAKQRAVVTDAKFTTAAAAPPQTPRTVAESVNVSVEITRKPRPEYTEEARRLRIQGEVLLRVRFSANGRVQVLNLIRGLGYGLDENAIRAAEQIEFKPASSDGTPVDSSATIRIAFQLAF